MLKKYKVKMNNKIYELEVELTEEIADMSIKAEPSANAAPTSNQQPLSTGAGESVLAPLPGVVLDIKKSVGQAVKKGELLLILEAMKMENEVFAPVDGVVKEVTATKGSNVTTGECLVVLG